MGIFNADVIINIPPAFFSLQKSGLVRVYLTSVFLLLSVPRCFGDQKPQFDIHFLRDFRKLTLFEWQGLRSAKVILNDLWKESGGEGAFPLAKKNKIPTILGDHQDT